MKDDSFDCTLIAHLRIFLLFYRLLYCLILPENRLFFGIWKVVEIEVAYAMNNFYRSSKAKKVEIKNELGEVVDKMLREVPYSGQSIDGEGFMIEDFPDLNCDVEHCVLTKMEQQDIHTVINQLNSEERMIIYGIFFENKTQTQMAEIMGISRQMLSYKLKSILNKMREMYMNKFF